MIKILTFFAVLLNYSVSAQQPVFKGDFGTFIKNNIIYPSYSQNNCLQGTIKIGFKIKGNGEVYQAKIIQGFGTDLDKEALRLVRMSGGKWMVTNLNDTASTLVVPVSFELKGYGCETKSQADLELAIQAYQNNEALLNVITDFYKHKEKGTFKAEDERRVEMLKIELNIDDDFLQSKLDAGSKKIKQGDKIGACEDFNFVKYMGSQKADQLLKKYCN